jgi:hypothetical protein
MAILALRQSDSLRAFSEPSLHFMRSATVKGGARFGAQPALHKMAVPNHPKAIN